MLKGFKTILTGALVAIGPAALQYLGGVNVTQTLGLSPTTGLVLGGIFSVLRMLTNTPVGSSTPTSLKSGW